MPDLTPEQQQAQQAAEIRKQEIAQKAAEYTALKGQWFQGNTNDTVYQVHDYRGVQQTAVGLAHVIVVERQSPRAVYTPVASDFLKGVHPIAAPAQPSTLNQVI